MTSPAANETLIARFLAGLGLNANADAGALGNFQVESGFNPAAGNAAEGAIGIAQWELGRRTALDAYASRTGGSETDLQTQLGYLQQELAGMPGFVAQLNAAGSPEAAAALWDSQFERSAGTTRAARQSNARAALSVAQNPGAPLTLPTGPGTASGPAGAGTQPASLLSTVTNAAVAPWVTVGGLFSDLGSSATGKAAGFLANAALKITFVSAGAALVVLGVYHTTSPARERITDQLAAAAPAAAAVA